MRISLFLSLILLLQACASPEASPPESNSSREASAEKPATPVTFTEKTPALPARFVDTTRNTYAWLKTYHYIHSLENRVSPPEGFQRISQEEGSFGDWLRKVPLKPGRPAVMLHNGAEKGNQEAHHLVLDLDVGKRDLQQCADAVMRLRAEYLYAEKRYRDIHFKFTSGFDCRYDKWKEGYRPKISGNKVNWTQPARPDASWPSFRKYMDMVYMYAGTASLEKELTHIPLNQMQIGDVFIQGGFPGHAVLVMDMAHNPNTEKKVFLLAQSYMPAQEMHILRNPENNPDNPWYDLDFTGNLNTPEWSFSSEDLHRF